MFIRTWGKPDNVGKDVEVEQYVAIRYIERFYAHSGFEAQNGDRSTRYIIATGADRFYITKKTFDYLKTLRDRNAYEKVGYDYR